MTVSDIQPYSLSTQYSGEVFIRAARYADFESVRSFIDDHHMICFIEEKNVIYAMNHEYRGITNEQADSIERILSIEASLNGINDRIGDLTYEPIHYVDTPKISGDNVTEFIKSVCNMLENGALRMNLTIVNIQEEITNLQNFLNGFDTEDSSIKEYIDERISIINEELQKMIELQKMSISGDNVHIEVEQDPENQFRYLINGKDIASDTDLQALTRQVSNIFGTVDNNIKDIVKQELESAFIPTDASESMDSIEKIVKWIHSHPNEYKDLSSQINHLYDTFDSLDEYAKKGNLYEPSGELKTIQGSTLYGTTLEEINEILKTMSFAKGVQDNAEENWLVGININDQQFSIKGQTVKFNAGSDDESETAKFIRAYHNQETRILDFGLETKPLETIIDKSIDTSTNEARAYVDTRLSWNIK